MLTDCLQYRGHTEEVQIAGLLFIHTVEVPIVVVVWSDCGVYQAILPLPMYRCERLTAIASSSAQVSSLCSSTRSLISNSADCRAWIGEQSTHAGHLQL